MYIFSVYIQICKAPRANYRLGAISSLHCDYDYYYDYYYYYHYHYYYSILFNSDEQNNKIQYNTFILLYIIIIDNLTLKYELFNREFELYKVEHKLKDYKKLRKLRSKVQLNYN